MTASNNSQLHPAGVPPTRRRSARRLLDFASQRSLIVLLVALGLTAILYTVYDLYFEPSYTIADWLINYSDGFVRRGLSGEFILLLAHALRFPPPWVAAAVPVAIYLAYLAGVYKLAAPLRRGPLWYAMLFSPAALPFMILEPTNACRKDILVMAALIAAIVLIRRQTSAVVLSLSIALLFAVMVLSHDALYSCFLYFFAATAVGARSLKYAARVMAGPFILAALLINIVRLHPGDDAVAMAICRSVGGRWIPIDDTRDLCSGAIKHIGWTLARSRREELANLHYWPLYALLAVLSFAPFIAALIVLYRRDGLRFEAKVIAWIAALCAVASLPLFYLTIDWGRWIHMQVICLLLVILMAAHRAPSFLPNQRVKAVTKISNSRAALAAVVFLYCACWTLPIYGGYPLYYGYVDVARFFHHEIPFLHRIDALHRIDRGW